MRDRRASRGRIALWTAFVAIHAWLAYLAWNAPLEPFNDVTEIYRGWIERGQALHEWVGIQVPSVYPPLALLPMAIAGAFGTSASAFGWTWLGLVTALDAAAVLVLSLRGNAAARRRGMLAAWWFLAFLLALGPVGVGRLESITTPLAIIAVRLLVERPAVAAAILAATAWIKIWPAAILAAAVVALRGRIRMVVAAAVVSLLVMFAVVALGGGGQLFSFLDGQEERGLQVESLLGAPWLIAVAAGAADSSVVWNRGINTFEVTGPGADIASALSTPLLLVLGAALLALGIAAAIRHRAPLDVLAPLAVAMVAVFVITNKVGSPQFTAWIAAPVVLAILASHGVHGRRRRAMRWLAGLGLLLALLTQLVYPIWYDWVLYGWMPAVVLLEIKNAIWIVLLVLGVLRLARLVRRSEVA